MATFKAKYAGVCSSCDSPINVADEITYASNELVHIECPDDLATDDRGFCPKCFSTIALNGTCECDE